jgi:hypothetical protein
MDVKFAKRHVILVLHFPFHFTFIKKDSQIVDPASDDDHGIP